MLGYNFFQRMLDRQTCECVLYNSIRGTGISAGERCIGYRVAFMLIYGEKAKLQRSPALIPVPLVLL